MSPEELAVQQVIAGWTQALGALVAIGASLWIAHTADRRAAAAERRSVERAEAAERTALGRIERAKSDQQNQAIDTVLVLAEAAQLVIRDMRATFNTKAAADGQSIYPAVSVEAPSAVHIRELLPQLQLRVSDARVILLMSEVAEKLKPWPGQYMSQRLAADWARELAAYDQEVAEMLSRLRGYKS